MKIAALDIGLKRIGIALCVHGDIVTPIEAVMRKNREQAARDVGKVLDEWSVDILVVGLPKDGSGAPEMARRIRHFTALLNFDKEVVFVEEDFSSAEAKEKMRGKIKQKKDGKVDSIAAGVILERYLRQS